MNLDVFKGFRIQVVPPVQVRVKRRWKERLFSFTPWISHRIELQEVMGEDIITDVSNRVMDMRMETKSKLEWAVAQKRAAQPEATRP